MAHSSPFRLVFTTCPDAASAEALAKRLVEDRLAACVNIVPGVRSVYYWEGKLETGAEQLLIIKTKETRYPELEARILAEHPYELPEVVSVQIDKGLPAYLGWIDSSLSEES